MLMVKLADPFSPLCVSRLARESAKFPLLTTGFVVQAQRAASSK